MKHIFTQLLIPFLSNKVKAQTISHMNYSVLHFFKKGALLNLSDCAPLSKALLVLFFSLGLFAKVSALNFSMDPILGKTTSVLPIKPAPKSAIAAPTVNCGTGITVDGDSSDWDLTADFFTDMHLSGDPTKVVLGKCYLRYNPTTRVLYILVLQVLPSQYNYMTPADDSYVKIGSLTKANGASGNNGVAPDFAFIAPDVSGPQDIAHGYECSFSITEGNYTGLNVHQQVFDGSGPQTCAVPNRSIAFNIGCGAACTPPTISSIAIDTATCTNGTANSDAKIAIRGITDGAKYSYGTNGTTGLYAVSATTLTADSIKLIGLANPSVLKTYTFRIYTSDTTCYNDTSVVLTPSVCIIPTINLSLSQKVDSASVSAAGRQVTFTLTVKNTSTTTATGVNVQVTSGTGFTFVSATPSVSYASGTGIWTIGTINASDSVTLSITVTADSVGINYFTAEISAADQPDSNSTPNNGVTTEDDIIRGCVTVPVPICSGQSYNATTPNGLTGIQWYKNGVAISGATNQVLTITAIGQYTFTATGYICPTQGCCPINVVSGVCPIVCKPITCLPVVVIRQ